MITGYETRRNLESAASRVSAYERATKVYLDTDHSNAAQLIYKASGELNHLISDAISIIDALDGDTDSIKKSIRVLQGERMLDILIACRDASKEIEESRLDAKATLQYLHDVKQEVETSLGCVLREIDNVWTLVEQAHIQRPEINKSARSSPSINKSPRHDIPGL